MELEKKIVGRIALSNTKCDLQEDGTWKAVSEIWDKVKYEGNENWIEEKVDAMSYNDTPEEAIQTAMGSTLNYLMQTVYNNGFKGLVEYRDYQRLLEDKKKEKV